MPDQTSNVLVLFYSRDGAVEALAKAIAEGAREAGQRCASAARVKPYSAGVRSAFSAAPTMATSFDEGTTSKT